MIVSAGRRTHPGFAGLVVVGVVGKGRAAAVGIGRVGQFAAGIIDRSHREAVGLSQCRDAIVSIIRPLRFVPDRVRQTGLAPRGVVGDCGGPAGDRRGDRRCSVEGIVQGRRRVAQAVCDGLLVAAGVVAVRPCRP